VQTVQPRESDLRAVVPLIGDKAILVIAIMASQTTFMHGDEVVSPPKLLFDGICN
jgi:hypothetical protein